MNIPITGVKRETSRRGLLVAPTPGEVGVLRIDFYEFSTPVQTARHSARCPRSSEGIENNPAERTCCQNAWLDKRLREGREVPASVGARIHRPYRTFVTHGEAELLDFPAQPLFCCVQTCISIGDRSMRFSRIALWPSWVRGDAALPNCVRVEVISLRLGKYE